MSDSDLLNPYDELRKQRILRNSRHAASLGIKNSNVILPPLKAKCPSPDMFDVPAPHPEVLTMACIYYLVFKKCLVFLASVICCIPIPPNMFQCHLLRKWSSGAEGKPQYLCWFVCYPHSTPWSTILDLPPRIHRNRSGRPKALSTALVRWESPVKSPSDTHSKVVVHFTCPVWLSIWFLKVVHRLVVLPSHSYILK